jgi:DNA-binding CsgD family transcriptional regulator
VDQFEEDLSLKLKLLADFARFSMKPDRNTYDVLAYLAHNVLVEAKIEGVGVVFPEETGSFTFTESYGRFFAELDLNALNFGIFDDNPAATAFRLKRVEWVDITQHPQSITMFGEVDQQPGKVVQGNIICAPLADDGIPHAVLIVVTKNQLEKNPVLVAFISSLAEILALRIHSKVSLVDYQRSRNQNYSIFRSTESLTDRQILILKLISDGMTNQVISDSLGYSESTIRQETIKIYSKLNCKGRTEASKIYAEQFSKSTTN